MEMNKVLKFELLNNCISCDLYLLFTRCYATRDTVKLLKYLNDKSNFYLSSQMCPYLICLSVMTQCSAGLTEGHVLVGAEESHELWHLDDLNESSLVDIEVTPGLGEVGVDVVIEHLA